MADLLDIVPSTAVEVVRINGERVIVNGLNAPAIASIAARFPEIRKVFGGGGEFVSALFELAGAAIGPIIAAGVGFPGDEKYEKHAATMLTLDAQVDLVTAIFGLTFPNGVTAFLAKLAKLSEGAGEKTVKVRLRKSHSGSRPSSDAGSLPTMQ